MELSKRSLNRLKNVHPILIAIVSTGIIDSPFDFGIPRHGGKRTACEQHLLFNQIPKVTSRDGFKKKSYHQSGLAFDIYGYVYGKATWDPEILEAIARHLIDHAWERYKVKLQWGGDWTKKDRPHFQTRITQLQ